jgi:hypothetical protein
VDHLPEHGELVVVEHDRVVGQVVVVAGAVVGQAPPERLDLREIGGVGEQLVHPVDDEPRLPAHGRVGQRLDDDLRAHAGRIAHGDADGGAWVGGVVGPGARVCRRAVLHLA